MVTLRLPFQPTPEPAETNWSWKIRDGGVATVEIVGENGKAVIDAPQSEHFHTNPILPTK